MCARSRSYFTPRRAARLFGSRLDMWNAVAAGWRVHQDTNVLESLNRVWEENVTEHAAGDENPLKYLYALFVDIPAKFSRTLHDAVARDVKAASDSMLSWTRLYGRELAEYLASLPSRLRDVVTASWGKSTDLLQHVVHDMDDMHLWHVGTRDVLLDGTETKCACPAFLGQVVADKHILAVLRVTRQWSHLEHIRRPPTHTVSEDVRAQCARLMNRMAENERRLRALRFAGTGGVRSSIPDVPSAAPGRATGGAIAHVAPAGGTQGDAAVLGGDAPDPRTVRNVLVEGLHALSSEIRNQVVSTERLRLIEEMLDRGRRDSGVPVSVTLAALSSSGGHADTGVDSGEGAVLQSGWILVPAFEGAPAFEFNPSSGARRAIGSGEPTGKRARVASEVCGDDATRVPSEPGSAGAGGVCSSIPGSSSAKRGICVLPEHTAASTSKRAKFEGNSGSVGAFAGAVSTSTWLDSTSAGARHTPPATATPATSSCKRPRGCGGGGGSGGGGGGVVEEEDVVVVMVVVVVVGEEALLGVVSCSSVVVVEEDDAVMVVVVAAVVAAVVEEEEVMGWW